MAVVFPALLNPLLASTDQVVNDQPASVVVEVLPEADQFAFVASIEKATKDEDLETWNGLIDWTELLKIALAGANSEAVNRARAEFKSGFMNANREKVGKTFAFQVIDGTKDGGSFKFLRLIQVENQPAALFRLVNKESGGVNYHQYFLKRSHDGQVRAHDVYIFFSGERFSETLRNIWLPVEAEASRSFLDRFLKPTDPLIAATQLFLKMQNLLSEGQFENALETYRKLPEAVQQKKLVVLMRLRAAMNISDEEYASAIEDFRKFFPNDAALDFLLIDGYTFRNDFEKVLECVNRTNEHVGGDSWMVSLRGITLARLGRFDEAREATSEAIQLEPDFENLYWNAITVSVLSKNDDETVAYLSKLESDFGTQITDLTEIPFYSEFVKSDQYAKWIESRK